MAAVTVVARYAPMSSATTTLAHAIARPIPMMVDPR
jgi:hypothetical protein